MPATTDTLRSALAAAGWAEVSDCLLTGLAEDLEGRVGSLHGLLKLLIQSEPASAPSSMGAFVEEEVSRLGDAVALLSLLRREDPLIEPDGLAPGAELPPLIDLHGRCRDLADVRVHLDVDSAAAALAPRSTFARLVLCALSTCSREALRRERRVELRVRSEGQVVTATFEATGQVREDVEYTDPTCPAHPKGVGRLAAIVGGRARWTQAPGGAWLDLELPAAP
jgi:hypothetical protein